MKKLLMLMMAGGLSLGIAGCGCKKTECVSAKTSTGMVVKKQRCNGISRGTTVRGKDNLTGGLNGEMRTKPETWAEKEERRLRAEEAKWREEWDKTEAKCDAKCRAVATVAEKLAMADLAEADRAEHRVNDDMTVGTMRPQESAMEESADLKPNVGDKANGTTKSSTERMRQKALAEKKARQTAAKAPKDKARHARIAAKGSGTAIQCSTRHISIAQHRVNDEMQVGALRSEEKRHGSHWAKCNGASGIERKPSEAMIRCRKRAKTECQLRQKNKIEERQLSLQQQQRYGDVMRGIDQDCHCRRAWWEARGRLEPFETQYMSGPQFIHGF